MYVRTQLVGFILYEALLVALTSAGLYYLYSSVVGLVTVNVVTFFLIDSRIFKNGRSGRSAVRFAKFSLFALVGNVANIGILYLATTGLHIPFSISNLIGIAATVPLSFAISLRYTWAQD
jgi:putative flippase GtrA